MLSGLPAFRPVRMPSASAPPPPSSLPPVPAVTLQAIGAAAAPTADTLATIGFGAPQGDAADPRRLQVPLLADRAMLEVWSARGPGVHGRDGGSAWASDGALLFGAIEIDEAAAGGIEAATAEAYARLLPHLRRQGCPHLLRIWNYLDAITEGDGDDERYRRFCVGRVRGLGGVDTAALPAATAIGRCDGVRTLLVYWLAARAPGIPLENPRQTAAWRYPRRYGPQSPSFARALLAPEPLGLPLLLSGTAAIVGHASLHPDSLAAQLDETLANLQAVIAAARRHRPALAPGFGTGTQLKVYVRDREAMDEVAALLDARLPAEVRRLLLHGHVCRRELRVEIEGVHA